MRLPTKMGEAYVSLLTIFNKDLNKSIKSLDLSNSLEKTIPRNDIAKIRHSLVIKGYLTFDGNNTKLTKLGLEVVNNLPNMKVVRSYRHGKTRPINPTASHPPEPITLNISKSATSLAESVSELISENEQLRELLKSINLKITQALEL